LEQVIFYLYNFYLIFRSGIFIKIFESKRNNNGIATSTINIGNIYYLQGMYPEALKYQIEALKANEATKNKTGIASCYNNIGDIYGKLGNYAASLKNFQAFLSILQEQNDEQGISFAYNNIGETYQNMGMEEEALKNHLASNYFPNYFTNNHLIYFINFPIHLRFFQNYAH
jgi:tetratricopeptide (TPR) repeat protein